MKTFLLCFIPLFVAVDTAGNVPIFLSLTESMPGRERKKVVWQACWTALVISILFMLLGKWLFTYLHITPSDFKIAGGLVLLFIAVTGILPFSPTEHYEGVGIVPLGVPLMMGPAALTTLLIQIDLYPVWYVGASLIVNIVVSFFAFYYSWYLTKAMGVNGMRAASKVISLFLAAIAVMMIRSAIQEILHMKGM
jgi:multiple antibiotic resistance protein